MPWDGSWSSDLCWKGEEGSLSSNLDDVSPNNRYLRWAMVQSSFRFQIPSDGLPSPEISAVILQSERDSLLPNSDDETPSDDFWNSVTDYLRLAVGYSLIRQSGDLSRHWIPNVPTSDRTEPHDTIEQETEEEEELDMAQKSALLEDGKVDGAETRTKEEGKAKRAVLFLDAILEDMV
jgi:hypothetical protein